MLNKFIFSLILAFLFLVGCSEDTETNPTFTNLESVTIGNQIWTKKNLDVSKYRNGDIIPQVSDPLIWNSLTTGAWCFYGNDSLKGAVYGKLYNWYAVNDPRGLAPQGWHIPNDDEWYILTTFFGNDVQAYYKLKEAGSVHWLSNNAGSTNESGFTAIPGGWRPNGAETFADLGYYAYWWTSEQNGAEGAWQRYINDIQFVYRASGDKHFGMSVRCVRD